MLRDEGLRPGLFQFQCREAYSCCHSSRIGSTEPRKSTKLEVQTAEKMGYATDLMKPYRTFDV